jgi:hypothetical protein
MAMMLYSVTMSLDGSLRAQAVRPGLDRAEVRADPLPPDPPVPGVTSVGDLDRYGSLGALLSRRLAILYSLFCNFGVAFTLTWWIFAVHTGATRRGVRKPVTLWSWRVRFRYT